MAEARNADFLGEGTNSSVLGAFRTQEQIAEDQMAARQISLREAAQTTRDGNLAHNLERSKSRGGELYVGDDAASRKAEDIQNGISGREYRTNAEQAEWEKTHQRGLGGNLIRDPITMGILAAPYGVLGAGAAIGGAAALGLGEAAAVGGSTAAVGPAAGGVVTAGSSAPTVATLGTGAGAASGLAGAAGTGGAAAAGGGLDAGDWVDIAGTAATLGLGAYDMLDTDAEKKLVAKQEQMAKEVADRRAQMQTAGMNALGSRLLAFDPQNQMMAQMFGPGAAFTPEQFGAMVQNPMGPPALYQSQDPTGMDQGEQQKVVQSQEALQAYQQEEERRRQMVVGGMSPLPQGATPLRPTQAQPARRF